MRTLHSEKCICACCMEEHEVRTVAVKERSIFKHAEIGYEAIYYYCDKADELYMDEKQIGKNDLNLKDAYRIKAGLLTSSQICEIRRMYGITQKDLCVLLGWGEKTITRYESHQVQDKAHDTILKKIGGDPEWFIHLLKNSKDCFTEDVYMKYMETADSIYEREKDVYLRKAIEAQYVRYSNYPEYNGNKTLSLDKVVDVIRFFAASDAVTRLYKVKLMKLMWYADMVSYRQRTSSITGLVYEALPMGAVPVCHNSIIDLNNVPCEEVDMGESYGYHFSLDGKQEYVYLSDEDKNILEYVIGKLGHMSKDEIVEFMHNEKAYIETKAGNVIPFTYADQLHI